MLSLARVRSMLVAVSHVFGSDGWIKYSWCGVGSVSAGDPGRKVG